MTPSAPLANAVVISSGSIRPEHITFTMSTLGGYCMRAVPALSAPVYEHQKQRKPMMRGSQVAGAFAVWWTVAVTSAMADPPLGGGGHRQSPEQG